MSRNICENPSGSLPFVGFLLEGVHNFVHKKQNYEPPQSLIPYVSPFHNINAHIRTWEMLYFFT
jgi:hypothetical protein